MPRDAEYTNKLIELINLQTKREVEKFCREASVTSTEFCDVLVAARFGGLAPYRYACHFDQLAPEHLLPTDRDNAALVANGPGPMGPGAQKFARKVSQLFSDRRVFAAHLLYLPSMDKWNLFYFDQRDMSVDGNHWKKGGPHIHYSRESYVNDSLDNVWARICSRPPKPPSSEHIRYDDDRERGSA